MALTMLDKQAEKSETSRRGRRSIAAEFEREKNNPNPCVGNALVSETDRVRVWTIRLKPGERDRLPSPRARLFLDGGDRRPRTPARA